MTVLLLFLMGYQFWGDPYHEVAGAAMFVLFIAHHLLNVNWYKNLFKGKYSPARVITVVVIVALHLGLHWNMILGMVRKMGKNKEVTTVGKTIMFVFGTAIAGYGLHVFIRRGLIQYMFLQTQFVFLDFMESKLFFYGEYISMMGFFIYVAHYVRKLFQKLQDRRAK